MQLSERNGNEIVASFPISDKDQLMLVTDKGKLIRCPVNDIRIAGRQTQRITLFNVSERRVVSVAKLKKMNSHAYITEFIQVLLTQLHLVIWTLSKELRIL